MENGSMKKAQKSKKPFVMIGAVLAFGAVFYYTFFLAAGPAAETAATATTFEQTYQEYQDYISDTNKGVKTLLDGEQLKNMDLHEYDIDGSSVERNTNPFVKTF